MPRIFWRISSRRLHQLHSSSVLKAPNHGAFFVPVAIALCSTVYQYHTPAFIGYWYLRFRIVFANDSIAMDLRHSTSTPPAYLISARGVDALAKGTPGHMAGINSEIDAF